MPDFSALSSAYSALAAHRRRTEVIAQNIANVDTPGYTRQRAELSALGGLGGASVISGTRRPLGVDVDGVTRMADDVLDGQARRASGRSGSLTEQARAASAIERRLGGVAEGSLPSQIDALWNGFADVANDPTSLGTRQVVIQQAARLSASMNDLATATVDQRRTEVSSLERRVAEINDLAHGIATLDRTIVAARAAGSTPNELVDEQAKLIDRLAQLVDIDVVGRPDGTTGVNVDGHDLVSEGIVKPLAVRTTADPALGALGFDRVAITVARPGGRELAVTGGQVNGLLTVVNDTLPDHLRQLDSLAVSIATTVNAVHVTGAGLDGVTGRRLFDPDPPTAATLHVSPDVAADPSRVAAGAPGAGQLDTTVARQLAALGDSPDNPGLVADRLVTSVGASVASITTRAGSAVAAAERAHATADSASGVNLDEELTNLMESQRAFEAAARTLTTIDEMLDTIINRTGLVGR